MKKVFRKVKTVLAAFAIASVCTALIPCADVSAADKKKEATATPEPTAAVTPTPEIPEEWNRPCIVVEKYSITDGNIIPGKAFTLTLTLKNYGQADANGLILNVSNPRGVAPVYGTVSQLCLGDIKAGEEREVQIAYDAFTSIAYECLDFEVAVASSTYTNYVVLTIPVSTDLPFSVTGNNGPDHVAAYQKATFSASFKVIGSESISGVSCMLCVDGQPVSENNIGVLSPGTVKTQNMSTQFEIPGMYHVEQVLTFIDENGIVRSMTINDASITVTEGTRPEVTPTLTPNRPNTQNQTENLLQDKTYILVFAGTVVLIVFLLAVVLLKKRK